MVQPFPNIEKIVKAVIETEYAPAAGKVGGDLAFEPGSGLYVYVSHIAGSGHTTATGGEWGLDIDVFADSYGDAMNHALAIEAMLLEGPHRTDNLIIDVSTETMAPCELPWEDETVTRIGSIWVFTARRRG